MNRLLANVGRIKTSKTFPSLCRASLETVISHLTATARIQTIDYNGEIQVRNDFFSGLVCAINHYTSLNDLI